MNTQEFLERILPRQGVYYAAYFPNKDNLFCCHKACSSIPELASTLLSLDKRYYAVFHACASYKQACVVGANGSKKSYRVESNRAFARTFWLDLDVGEGKGFATKDHALAALHNLCKKFGVFPMTVSSGHGVHAYFIMDRDIPAEEWDPVALRLDGLLKHVKFPVDPSRTKDFASILRPVGTHNKKATPLPVELIEDAGPISFDWFRDRLLALTKGLKDIKLPNSAPATEEEIALDKGPSDPNVKARWDSAYVRAYEFKADAGLICEKCQQMKRFRDSKGDLSYWAWFAGIGVLKYCENGEQLAKDWSANRAATGHTNTDTALKWDSWDDKKGPGTCELFARENSGCEGCPNRGKVKTPYSFGFLSAEELHEHDQPPQEAPMELATSDFGTSASSEDEVKGVPGYYWGGDDQGLMREVEDRKGVLTPRVFCKTRFVVVDRSVNGTGEMEYVFSKCDPFEKTWSTFRIPCGACTGNDLIRNLATYGIVSSSGKDSDSDMKAYVKDCIDTINRRVKATRTISVFGWQDDGSFVIGTRAYKKGDESYTQVLVDKNRREDLPFFPDPIGTAQGYADAFNAVYANQGMEPFQYAICSLWGSPLVQLCNSEYNGIPCALTGIESGLGKTTAAKVAFCAFGNSAVATTNGFGGITINALPQRLAGFKNLPLILDEMTDGTKSEYSRLLYQLANGANKDRLNSDGSAKKRLHWRSQCVVTGNSNITSALTTDDANASAQQMRVFEISIDDFPNIRKFSDPNFVANKVKEMEKNCGAVGDVYIKYLVNHADEIKQRLIDVLDPTKHADCKGVLFTEPQARFYRYHISCSLVAAAIMKELGISRLDLRALREFAIAQGNALVTDCLSKRRNALLLIRDILSSLADYTLTTDHFGRKPAIVLAMPKKGPVKVRIVNSIAANKHGQTAEPEYAYCDNTVIVYTDDVEKYLNAKREGSLKSLKKELQRLKALKEHKKLDLSMGVTAVTAYRAQCYVLDLRVISPDLFFGEQQ